MMDHIETRAYEHQPAATMKVLREELPMERYVGAASSQAVVEGEVALPGGLREETRVLSAEAMSVAEKAETLSDRVEVEGRVIFHVLYTQGDPTHILALEASAEFTHSVDMPGVQPKMTATPTAVVEHVEAVAQGGRLHLRSILRAGARVLSNEPFSVVTSIQDAEGLMAKAAVIQGCLTVATGEQDVLVRDECELAGVLQIQDTLYATALATVNDVMGGEERVTLSGNILMEVIHCSNMPSRSLVVTRHTIPFEETLPLMGEAGDALCANAIVKDVAVLSQDGTGEGERTLRAEVLLALRAQTTRKKDMVILQDAYTTQGDLLTPVVEEVRRALGYQQIHTAESGKMTLLLEGEQPPARTPIKAFLRPIVTDVNRQGGRLLLDGMMETTLLYMTDGSEVPVSYSTEEPFHMVFACDVSDPEGISLMPSNVDVNGITSDRVEIKYILHLFCNDVQLTTDSLVSDVTRQPAQPVSAGIVLYFTQPEETLWDIAKRYQVSKESLQRMNPELVGDGPFEIGRSVILWQRGAAEE
ncbi:MAG: DUF3794 domain-containing protein [Clostridiales bacterium]|nr:DUF3794 domain-containing protein [Clostridiales bacterium]